MLFLYINFAKILNKMHIFDIRQYLPKQVINPPQQRFDLQELKKSLEIESEEDEEDEPDPTKEVKAFWNPPHIQYFCEDCNKWHYHGDSRAIKMPSNFGSRTSHCDDLKHKEVKLCKGNMADLLILINNRVIEEKVIHRIMKFHFGMAPFEGKKHG